MATVFNTHRSAVARDRKPLPMRARDRWLLAGLLAGACSDYNLTPGDSAPPGGDPPVERDPPRAPLDDIVEICDGIDNNGDGRVDEGNGDLDGDGIADCVDDACEVEAFVGEDVGAAFACEIEVTPSIGPWDLEVMWDSPASGGCNLGTVVFDANGDGVSDVACNNGMQVNVHNGRDGSILYDIPCWGYTSIAVADVDGDESWDLFTLCSDDHASNWRARRFSGRNEVWATEVDLETFDITQGVELADLEGDGVPELVLNAYVIDATSGAILRELDRTEPLEPWKSGLVVADLDGDGVQDAITGRHVWRSADRPWWSAGAEAWDGEPIMHALVAPLGQTEPWIFFFGEVGMGVLTDFRGRQLANIDIEEDLYVPSAACAGDLDGDGEMEVVHTGRWLVQAFRHDGSTLWSVPNDDWSTNTGCTTFDFDLDGAKEVVHSHETAVRVLDGATGAVLWEDTDWTTDTLHDIPLIADLDGDGSVELIMTNRMGTGYGSVPLRVYRNVHRDWPPGSRIWPSATWSGTSLYADGAVPRHPATPWTTTRIWRGQPEVMVTGSDLRVEVVDACAASCEADAMVQLAVRLVNGGPEEVHRPVTVAAWALAADGARTLVGTLDFSEYLLVGHASSTQILELTVGDVQEGLVLVAGDDGSGAIAVDDCDQDNNETSWTLEDCQED